MQLQPYGPVEQAIDSPTTSEIINRKFPYGFLWGILAAVIAGGTIYLIVQLSKKQERKKENDIHDKGSY